MEKNSNVIKFPTDRVVYNNKPVKPEPSEEEARRICHRAKRRNKRDKEEEEDKS